MEDETRTLKISAEDHDWLTKEQIRVRQAEGEKPSHADLFLRMRKAYLGAAPQVGMWPDIPGRYQRLFRLLADVVRSGDREAIAAVSANLVFFAKHAKRD